MSENKTKLDDNHLLAKLKERYDLAIQYYGRDHRRMRMLDMTDNGDLWRAIGAKFPAYQILPDTNFVSYVKDNLLASLYTTAKSAEVRPTSEDDKDLCVNLNIILENLWDKEDIAFKQFQAGERAALLNVGYTQVGWDDKYYDGSNKGHVVLKNIDPIRFLRDPFAENLETSSWCCTYEKLHKSIIMANEHYKKAFESWLDKGNRGTGSTVSVPNYGRDRENVTRDNLYNVFKWWVRNPDGSIDEFHTIDDSVILFRRESIKPAVFPFAELYCNLPSSGIVGVSCPAKVFANDVAYNMMNSLALTAEYKNQRPPKFVSAQSGLNIAAFTKYGAEADRTFVVQNDAERAVHYHQFPNVSPNINNVMEGLQNDIQSISGIDGRYTGRDTGSIITTGGTEEMLNRVTMIDTPKIVNYEHYTKELTKLILQYMIEYSPKRTYFYKKQMSNEYDIVEVDFPKIDKKIVFEYDIEISSELPKNKQRVAAWADTIMEKQMQYREGGGNVELITEEEWLMMQDIPFKEYMMDRMGVQRSATAMKETSQVLYQYAGLLEQGMTPEDAIRMTASTLDQTRKGIPLAQAEQTAQQQMGGMPMAVPEMGGAPAVPPEESPMPMM